MKFAYFGSSTVSIYVLEELEKAGFVPTCIVTTPDKHKGRGLVLTPNVVKEWGLRKKIPVLDPATLDATFEKSLRNFDCVLFIVAAYGKIMPRGIIEMPQKKTLNVHPSLLPLYRGASPLPSVILADDKNTGISIMRLDEKMDHGPVVAQKKITVNEWPVYEVFEEMMAREGGRLLAEILPDWMAGKIPEQEQDHERATFTKKIVKEDALIDFTEDSYLNFRKIQAYHEWPQAYFFVTKGGRQLRVKITEASYSGKILTIEKVIPEGSKEMPFADFCSGYNFKLPQK